MSEASEAEALYARFMTAEDLAKVAEMDYPDQVYFWTMLYHEMPRHLRRSLLNDMEREVMDGAAKLRVAIRRAEDSEYKRLDQMWDSTKPHAWFKPTVR